MQNIKAKYDMRYSTNLPLELSYHIAAYIKDVHKRQLAPDFTITLMNNSLNNMVQCLGGLERISTTSTPLSYAIHLFQLTYIFILALPFQLIGPLNWYAIPTVALAAFSLLGIYVIGLENENAFWQEDILPFKYFCNELHEEILSITSHPMPTPKSWLLSTENQPFATTYLNQGRRTPASQLIKRKEDELRKMLKEAGRQVPLRKHLYKERKEEEKKKNKSDRKSGTVPSAGAGPEGENEELVP
ncbi:hypothetical protein Ocin01_15027 [Orchesella cincta]|uniref:Uncharacterized protein n=1 Tax=Orchesella cincta TaxID=48709 RepID=A0A1D2MF66_ORCCI|nr:hypothetical protein Ocin01_15027 [Orchesella cincta]